MSAPALIVTAPARELAHREADGIDVTLLWHGKGDVEVLVVDTKHNDTFSVYPPSDQALDAFEHPYVYRVEE